MIKANCQRLDSLVNETNLAPWISQEELIVSNQDRDEDLSNPVQPIPPVGHPFERWGIDFLQNLPLTKLGNRHVITCIDYCTRWVVAKATSTMSADQVVQFLYSSIFMQYRIRFEIVSDLGSPFLSGSVSQFLNVKHLPSTSFHPQTNGMVKSMHRMLNHSITTKSVFALHVRTHSVTKKSPYKLLFGLEPRLFTDNSPPIQVRAPWTSDEGKHMNFERTAQELDEYGQSKSGLVCWY